MSKIQNKDGPEEQEDGDKRRLVCGTINYPGEQEEGHKDDIEFFTTMKKWKLNLINKKQHGIKKKIRTHKV